MTENVLLFEDLKQQVLAQLKEQGYMDSTLTVYRRTYNRIHKYINERGTDIYTSKAGEEFLNDTDVSTVTMVSYACAIRRLDDYIKGNDYRCHHGNPSDGITDIYADDLTAFLDECKLIGNKPATIQTKERVCTLFLNHIAQAGCSSFADLDVALVSKALLIFINKDSYAIIRLFLKYLADKGITKTDFSGIVPKYKRRKVLPTTYTPAEINQVESSINSNTDTGKRDLAIVMLATRMGLRSGDIAKLRCSEIDFSTGYINIFQEKTGQPLSLLMPQEVSDALLRHLDNLTSLPADGFVFHSMSAPYGRITTSIIRHAVANGFISAGINIAGKKHGPHSFRSSLASSMVNDGVSYETVRRILGHSDPNVIKHYARTDVEKLRLCSIEPPAPSGFLSDYLSGKKVVDHV